MQLLALSYISVTLCEPQILTVGISLAVRVKSRITTQITHFVVTCRTVRASRARLKILIKGRSIIKKNIGGISKLPISPFSLIVTQYYITFCVLVADQLMYVIYFAFSLTERYKHNDKKCRRNNKQNLSIHLSMR